MKPKPSEVEYAAEKARENPMHPDSHARTPQKPEISIIDRRLKAGSIFASASIPIPATEPGRWTFREVNTRISDDHLNTMLHKKFWAYATVSDLACDPGAFSFREQDKKLVKGPHGEIVLMKMPTADYQAVQAEKDRQNRLNTFGDVKRSVVSAADAQDQTGRGAEFLDRHLKGLTVTDSRELVPLDDAA